METRIANKDFYVFQFLMSALLICLGVFLFYDVSRAPIKNTARPKIDTPKKADQVSEPRMRKPEPPTIKEAAAPPPTPAETKVIDGKDAVQMVYIPSGVFVMGQNDGPTAEGPRMSVFIDDFYIDRVEISNERFSLFMIETSYKQEGKFKAVKGEEYLPAVHLTWNDVKAYCDWAGERMPTEYEWEKAARGPNGLIWPWGDNPNPAAGKPQGNSKLYAITDDPKGQSPYGCLHMADNVWEWTSDWFHAYVLNSQPDERYGEKLKVLRGGLIVEKKSVQFPMAASRMVLDPKLETEFTGGRCAKTP